ncbi:MAG: phospholipid carrier-dependent glycosyltransferase [Desulfobacteraceae bacterium]|nr:phospholipid carrier-dependent glycosyltransferase [Desulfobacteraceae bacterium]
MHVKKQYSFLLLAIFLMIYILPLGARDLIVPDETRYGEIPREMIAGDWVSPHLNGVRYFEKPVLGYWVHAGSIFLFGENNFAVRLPSAVAVGLSALLIYVLVCRVCSSVDEKSNWAAVILAVLTFLTCFEVFGVGNTAVLDSLLSFFLTATITTFYFASEAPPGSAREKQFLLLSGVSCGLAFLTKGFLAFAVPVLVVAPYLTWLRRYRDLWRMSWLPIVTAALVALPWCILIHLREPDFWRFFFWNEHVRRFMADSAQHKESFWFFLIIAPGMFMPWTFVTPAAMAGIKVPFNDRGPQGRLIRLSICWLVLPFLFFSVSNGKLLTYILPCFPPFAILMAFGLLYAFKKEGRNNFFQWGAIGNVILFGLILLAFVYVQLFGYKGFQPYSQPWKAIMAVNALVFVIIFCCWSFRSQERIKKIILFGLSPFLLFFTAHFILPDLTIEKKAPGILLERYRHGIGQNTIVISDEDTIRAVCWYLKRSDVYVLGGAGELDYGLAYEDAAGKLLEIKSAVRLIDCNQGKTVLVARAKSIRRWQDQLPKPVSQDDSGPEGYVLWRY